ncbi:MAG: aminotransferase class IV [Bacteroidia bacterium]
MILLNGTLIKEGAPELNLLNRAFKYGDGLFESTRIVDGKPLLWEEHMMRLARGAKALGMDLESSLLEKINEDVLRTIEANSVAGFGRLRLTVYRGGGGDYFPLENKPEYPH